MFKKISFLIIFSVLQPSLAKSSCLSWMISAEIYPQSKNCEARCSVIPTGMGDFSCPSSCEELCKTDYLPKALNQSALGLIGYTADEISMAIKSPSKMKKAKLLSEKATQRTLHIFRFNGRNDESDAFRHFLWAGLMTKELGKLNAVKILNAHESNPDQPSNEKEMDVFNNTEGVKESAKLINEGNFNQNNLEKKALELIRNKKLKVIKQSGEIPKWR